MARQMESAIPKFEAARRPTDGCTASRLLSATTFNPPIACRCRKRESTRQSDHRPTSLGLFIQVATIPHDRTEKKTDVAEHPQVFGHVGLLVNGLREPAASPFT
jgi:hypothetical protein